MSRTEENDDRLRREGAHPVRVDLFDVEALKQVVAGNTAIYHVAAKIPLRNAGGAEFGLAGK